MTKGRNRTRHGNDGLKSKVFDTKFYSDKKGKYFYFCNALENIAILESGQRRAFVPFCGYRTHQGLVDAIDVCKKRSCSMFRKISLMESDKHSHCDKLYRVYMRKNKKGLKHKRYVNRR